MKSKLAAVLAIAAVAAACASGATEKEKKMLTRHGSIDGEWQIRDEAGKKTYTYILLRNKSGTHETYQITATDGRSTVVNDQVGGIDGTGCFLIDAGLGTSWITQKGPEILQGVTKSGSKTRTACLEYKDTAGWPFIPEKDRKAAEPPPPPPAEPPAAGPDAGTPDAATPAPDKPADKGEVKSAMPM